MKRRKFIQTAALGAVLAAPAIVNAQALPHIRWRLASGWPKNLGTIYCGAYTVAQRVSAATGGLFEISVHGSGEIVSALEVADAVQQGSVECAHTASVFFFGKDTTFALDGQIPFVMTSRQMTGWMYSGGGQGLLREFYRDYNIVNFACGNTGTHMGASSAKSPRSITIPAIGIRVVRSRCTSMRRLGSSCPMNTSKYSI